MPGHKKDNFPWVGFRSRSAYFSGTPRPCGDTAVRLLRRAGPSRHCNEKRLAYEIMCICRIQSIGLAPRFSLICCSLMELLVQLPLSFNELSFHSIASQFTEAECGQRTCLKTSNLGSMKSRRCTIYSLDT